MFGSADADGADDSGDDDEDDEKWLANFCMRKRLARPHVEQIISTRGCPGAKKFCTLDTPGNRMDLQRLQIVRFTSGALECQENEPENESKSLKFSSQVILARHVQSNNVAFCHMFERRAERA